MKKQLWLILMITLIISQLLSVSATAASYPSSGVKIPAGSELLEGTVFGEENGWDGTPNTGSAAAFDGDVYTYYDPTSGSDLSCFAGIKLSEPYILTKVCIMPREGWTDRFMGAMIQGSNDCERWYTLWQSESEAAEWDWQVITKFKSNIGYKYYRYTNDKSHGDVAEVEFYGYSGTTGTDPSVSAATTVDRVTVSFADGETTLDFDSIDVAFGENYPEITYVPEKDGMQFSGWYTSVEGGRRIDSTSVVTDPADHTLYAHWKTAGSDEITEDDPSTDHETENLSKSPALTPIQSLCVTLSVLFVLAAAVYIAIKRS